MNTLAIDPGKRSIAWAFFYDDVLEACGLRRFESLHSFDVPAFRNIAPSIHRVVAEVPQVYRQIFQKGDPNDLVDLAVTVGAAIGFLSILNSNMSVELVRPKAWKGQRPKDVDNAFVLRLLGEAEERVYESSVHGMPKGLRHNVIDAIGIGLWKVRRR